MYYVLMNENYLTIETKNTHNKQTYLAEAIIHADNVDVLTLLSNTPTHFRTLLFAARNFDLITNTDKSDFIW